MHFASVHILLRATATILATNYCPLLPQPEVQAGNTEGHQLKISELLLIIYCILFIIYFLPYSVHSILVQKY
jgi:hypothetical protein